jgi:hypothetical protein
VSSNKKDEETRRRLGADNTLALSFRSPRARSPPSTPLLFFTPPWCVPFRPRPRRGRARGRRVDTLGAVEQQRARPAGARAFFSTDTPRHSRCVRFSFSHAFRPPTHPTGRLQACPERARRQVLQERAQAGQRARGRGEFFGREKNAARGGVSATSRPPAVFLKLLRLPVTSHARPVSHLLIKYARNRRRRRAARRWAPSCWAFSCLSSSGLVRFFVSSIIFFLKTRPP